MIEQGGEVRNMEKIFQIFVLIILYVILPYVSMQSWESESKIEGLNLFCVSCVDESIFSLVKF